MANFGGSLAKTIECFENYIIGEDVLLMYRNKEYFMKVKIVEDCFKINDYL